MSAPPAFLFQGVEENLPFPIMLFIVRGQDLMTGAGSSYEQEDDQETKARSASWFCGAF